VLSAVKLLQIKKHGKSHAAKKTKKELFYFK
jgi:hypothetical protein